MKLHFDNAKDAINSGELVDRLRKFLDDSNITMQQMRNEIKNLENWK